MNLLLTPSSSIEEQRRTGRIGKIRRQGLWIPVIMLFAILQFHSSAFAQFDTAVVLGTVTDPSGAAIPGADVTLRNTALGTVQTKKTSGSGDYEFPGIQIGSYTVSANAPGFTPVTTNAFDVTISARQRANISLGVGNQSQDVTISAGATGLETDTSDQSLLIERKQIVDLPLNGREYTDLALLSPGVQVGVLQDGSVNQRRGSFVVNGMRSTANNFLLDGLDNNDYQIANQGFNNEAVDESVDAVQEFRVDTSNFPAEYGRAGGAIINVSTRSGTKDFHGSAWEYIRNTIFNAYGPFYGTGQKPALNQNQFGGTLGGPIPFINTFFFADYEGFRQISRAYTSATIPTASQGAGIFLNENNVAIPLQNPYTGTKYANGVILASAISPFAAAALAALPLPNVPGFSNNFVYLPPGHNYRDIGDVRLDHYFGSNIQTFVRLSKQSGHILIGPNIPGISGGGGGGHLRILTSQIASGLTYTITPHTLLDARLGFTWTESGKYPYNYGLPSFYPQFNIPYPVDPIFGSAGLNTQKVRTFSAFGVQQSDNQYTNPNTINPKVSFTLDRTHHSISFGYEYLSLVQAISTNNPIYGTDTYAGNFSAGTGGPASSTARSEAYSLADFMFGARSSYEMSNRINVTENMRFHYLYGEDSWKVRPNLTFNYGLRYEFVVPQWESGNHITNFDPTTLSMIPATNGSMASRSLVNPQYMNFAPRFGFSYSAYPKIVFRGGYGISYIQYHRNGAQGSLDQNGPQAVDTVINQTVAQGVCPAGSMSTACFRTTQEGYPASIISPSAFSTLQSKVIYIPRNSPTAYIESYSLGTEVQLAKQTILGIAYVGSHSLHLKILADYNQAAPQAVGGKLSLQARRPISTFTDIGDNLSVGFLKYNSLQVKVQHQMKSLFILNSFTWSKAFDLAAANGEGANGDSEFVNFANIHGDAGVSGYNQPLNDSLALTWDMPFGRNNRALHGAVKQAISGWTLTAINRMTSGLPINLTYDPATTALTTDLGYGYRPNITGNVSSLIIPKKSWTRSASATSTVFNVSQISVPAANAPYGNSGRNSLNGPGYYNLDAGIHKTFSLTEKLNLAFRAEAFNVFNNTNFKSPGTDYSAAGFGQYTAANVFPSRELQFAVRLVY